MLWRYLALTGGLFCVGCETWGTYDFLAKDQGGWNYIVAGGVAVALIAGLLPAFAEHAGASGRRALKIGCWLALPLALVFIFMAAIQRTGGAADAAQQARVRAERERSLAERSEVEATEALKPARAAAATECASGRGKRCLEAETKVQAAQDRIDAARRVLAAAPVQLDDPLARRLVLLLPFLSQEQVRLYQPLLLPILLSIFGAVLLAIGSRAPEAPGSVNQDDETQIREYLRRLAWDASAPEQIDMGDGQYILKSDLRKAVASGKL